VGVSGQTPDQLCFQETNKCIRGEFLAYWLEHGQLAVNGFPLSDPLNERLKDGQLHTVQYFEWVRMEGHPQNPPPYTILLGQFGRLLYLTDANQPKATAAPRLDGMTYFEDRTIGSARASTSSIPSAGSSSATATASRPSARPSLVPAAAADAVARSERGCRSP
jgi:hypothetical protein